MVDEPAKLEAHANLARRTLRGRRVVITGTLVGVVCLLSIWAAPARADFSPGAQDEAGDATKALWQAVSDADPAQQVAAAPVLSVEDRRQMRETAERLLARVDLLDPRLLSPQDGFIRELLRYHLRRRIEEASVRPEIAPYLLQPQPWAGGHSVLAGLKPDARAEAFDTLLRRYTTADVSGAAVHHTALAAAGASREAMRRALPALGYSGSLDQFLAVDFRNGQYRTGGDDVERHTTVWLSRIADLVPAIFSVVPRLPQVRRMNYGVPLALYRPEKDGQPALVFIDPASWPTPTLLPIVLHEVLPGHHLQHKYGPSATLPKAAAYLERDRYNRGFVEGWAFYAENLTPELGLALTPADEFGIAYMRLMREVRAVTDTGVHLHGWSTQRARDYMGAMLHTTPQAIEAELARLATPGEGAVYFVGRQVITNLRERAESQAGAAFDLRAFHDWLLTDGSMPLVMLEERFDACLRSSACPFTNGSRLVWEGRHHLRKTSTQ